MAKTIEQLLKEKQQRELKDFRKEEKRKKRLEKIKKDTEYYKAEAKRRKAKRSATKSNLLGLPVKKKKQSGKLSRKMRIRLI